MNFTDPFKQDVSRFKSLLAKDSGDAEYEEIDEGAATLLNQGTVKGLPPSILKKAKEMMSNSDADQETIEKASVMFGRLFTDLNSRYQLDVSIDFNSFSNSLMNIIEPSKKRIMECYLSEAYGRIRVILYAQYLQAIVALSSQLLDPKYILSESMTYDQKLDVMQKLFEFMNTINEIYKDVNIEDTELKLEKISSDNKPQVKLDSPEIQDILDSVFKKIK